MATNIILCTPATPNNVTLYDPTLGCGGSTAWTKSLADTITLSDELAKSARKLLSDSVTLSDILSGGSTGEDGVFRSIEYWAYIYFGTNGIFRKAFKYVVSIIS